MDQSQTKVTARQLVAWSVFANFNEFLQSNESWVNQSIVYLWVLNPSIRWQIRISEKPRHFATNW